MSSSENSPQNGGKPSSDVFTSTAPPSILVVEDFRTTADIIGMFLESHGYQVRVAYDGEQAVKESILFPPDLVIMDLGLPELNGLDASMEIRKRHPHREIRFIALSGFDDRETVNRCMDFGFDAHIPKPGEPGKILEVIRSLSDRWAELPGISTVRPAPREEAFE